MQFDYSKHRGELRVSNMCTVYHKEHGHLCFGIEQYDVILFFPVEFKNKLEAIKWIESGSIAKIQESMSLLNVGFVKESMVIRKFGWEV